MRTEKELRDRILAIEKARKIAESIPSLESRPYNLRIKELKWALGELKE